MSSIGLNTLCRSFDHMASLGNYLVDGRFGKQLTTLVENVGGLDEEALKQAGSIALKVAGAVSIAGVFSNFMFGMPSIVLVPAAAAVTMLHEVYKTDSMAQAEDCLTGLASRVSNNMRKGIKGIFHMKEVVLSQIQSLR